MGQASGLLCMDKGDESGRGEQNALLNDAIALSNERISLLKQSLGAKIADSRKLTHIDTYTHARACIQTFRTTCSFLS